MPQHLATGQTAGRGIIFDVDDEAPGTEGNEWILRIVEGRAATAATAAVNASILTRPTGTRLRITMSNSGAVDVEAGNIGAPNQWTIRSTILGSATSIVVFGVDQEILISHPSAATVQDLIDEIADHNSGAPTGTPQLSMDLLGGIAAGNSISTASITGTFGETFSGYVPGMAAIAREPIAFNVDEDAQEMTLTCIATDSVSAIVAAIGTDNATLQVAGSNNRLFSGYFSGAVGTVNVIIFVGGVQNEPIEVVQDDDTKTATVHYLATDSLQDIKDALGDVATFYLGTDESADPEAATFADRPFSRSGLSGGGSGASTGAALVTKSTTTLPDMSSWNLLWQAGGTTDARIAAGNTGAFRITDRPLLTGEDFSSHVILVAWIDNSAGKEGKFMYIRRELFTSEFAYTSAGGGWVDWSDNNWIGISYLDDTTFRFRGNNMGLRRIYGTNDITVLTDVVLAGGGGGGGAGDILQSVDTIPDDVVANDIWNRDGLLLKHVTHPGTDRVVDFVTISDARLVNDDGIDLANPNYTALYLGYYPTALLPTNPATDQFWMNAGHVFIKHDGTVNAPYDPFADGEPWDMLAGPPAWVDLLFQSGANVDEGVRVTMVGKHASQVGVMGNDWHVDVNEVGSISPNVSAQVNTANPDKLEIILKSRTSGNRASLNEIVTAINAIAPTGTLAGVKFLAELTGGAYW